MTIGKLAKEAGVGVETIRFYERKGLLRRPAKREAGYRLYPVEDAARVQFIKRAQELGFTLREIKQIMDIQSKSKFTGAQVKAKAIEKISEIEKKISDLSRMKQSLERLSKVCGEGEQAIRECKVFECFGKNC